MRSRRTCVSIGHIVGGGSSEEQWCQGKCESKHARKILHTLFYEFGKQYLGSIPHNFAHVTQQYRQVIDRYKMVIVYEHESKMFLDKNGFSLQASMQRKPARMPTKGPLKDMLNCWRSCWFTLRKPARTPTKDLLKDMLNCWRSCRFTLTVLLVN